MTTLKLALSEAGYRSNADYFRTLLLNQEDALDETYYQFDTNLHTADTISVYKERYENANKK